MRGRELVDPAERVARLAHADQVDKAGAPYIGHPARVAADARRRAVIETSSPAPDDVEATAWLHDVAEDTALTLDHLAELGFPARVVAAVDALTRKPGESSDTYYARVAADPLALVVKLADIADNSDPDRLAMLDTQTRERLTIKYDHARHSLARLAPP